MFLSSRGILRVASFVSFSALEAAGADLLAASHAALLLRLTSTDTYS